MSATDFLRDVFARNRQQPNDVRRACRAALGSLPLVASALVEQVGKHVRVQGGGAAELGATDGKTIYLMNFPIPHDDADVDSYMLMLALGYGLIHHEVGHVNHSTFPLDEKVARDPVLSHLSGIIEDVRQERVHIARLPGAKAYLDALNAALQVTGHFRPVTMQDPPLQVLTGYLLFRLYWEYRRDSTCRELAQQAEIVVKQMFVPGITVRLETLLPRMDELESTADADDLARDIKALLKDEIEKAKQQQAQQQAQQNQGSQSQGQSGQQQGTQGQGQQQGQGSPSQQQPGANGQQQQPSAQGQDQNSGQGPSDPSQSNAQHGDANHGQSQGQGSDTQQGQGQQQGQNQKGGETTTGAGGSGASDQGDLAQQIANTLSALNGEAADQAFGDRDAAAAEALQSVQRDLTSGEVIQLDGSHLRQPVAEMSQASLHNPGYDMAEAVACTGRLRVKLLQEMQAATDAEVVVGCKGRKLSSRHLARVGSGDGRIFRRKDQDIEIDTSVCLALDSSGSMKGSSIELACQALFATARALESIEGVETAATGFPNGGVLKPFGVKAKFSPDRYSLNALGGTPMADGIFLSVRMLARQATARKILVVITDGMPNSVAEAELAILAAEQRGIEVYGLGICTDCGKAFFPRWESIQGISELPVRLMGLLRSRLLGQAA